MKFPFLVLISIIFLNCCSGGQQTTDQAATSTDPNIPAHLQDIENLKAYPTDKEPTHKYQFIRETRYGETDELLIGRPGNIAVDDSGRVFMPDYDFSTINIFDQEGDFVTSIGRDGQGPGEFRSINSLLFHDDHLYVYDVGLRRINIFSLDSFEYVNSILFFPDNSGRIENPGGAYPIMPIAIREDGSLLITYLQIRDRFFEPEDPGVDAYHRFYTVTSDGREFIDRVFQQTYKILFPILPDRQIWMPNPASFSWVPQYAIANNQYIYSAEREDFLIEVFDPDGVYQYAFYHPFNRRLLSDEDLDDLPSDVTPPSAWPALNSMMTDDENRLWVSTIVDSDEIYEWWVLQDTGELISRFEWPRDKSIEIVKNVYLYSRETGDEGLISYIKYRIEAEAR